MTEKTHMQVKYDATPEILEALKNKGVQNPTENDDEETVLINLKTGKLGPQNIYPFTMEYVKTTGKDSKEEIPDNTLFYGKDTLGRIPVIDSISTPAKNTLNVLSKRILLQNVQDLFQKSFEPEKRLKVGEQFVREYPVDEDFGFTKLHMVLTTTYKLVSIANNLATFEIKQVYNLSSTIKDHTFKGEGEGSGKMVYDIADNYYKDYNVNMSLSMSKDIGGIYADIHTQSNISILTELVQN